MAQRWTEGHAYLLVGVEEGAVHGVKPEDIEKVDGWLARYLGPFDRYQFTYVPVDCDGDKKHVMFVDVLPPQWGDTIHALHKAYESHYAGTVFHRYAGKTEPARPAERARRAAQRIDVRVELGAGGIALLSDTTKARRDFVERRREDLLKSLEVRQPWSSLGGIAGLQAKIGDGRTPQEFREEVEQYLLDLSQALRNAIVQAVGTTGLPVELQLTNPGEENLTKVEVVLTLPAGTQASVVEDDEVELPDHPQAYGTKNSLLRVGRFPAFRPNNAFVPTPTPDIEHGADATVIRFVPVDLHPHESVRLDPIILTSPEGIGELVVARCRATATNVSGDARQELSIPTRPMRIDLAEVLDEDETGGDDTATAP